MTEVLVYPRAKVLTSVLGRRKLDQLLDMQGSVVAFARAMGCAKMTIQGRKGWVRALAEHGWKHTHAVVMKDI